MTAEGHTFNTQNGGKGESLNNFEIILSFYLNLNEQINSERYIFNNVCLQSFDLFSVLAC